MLNSRRDKCGTIIVFEIMGVKKAATLVGIGDEFMPDEDANIPQPRSSRAAHPAEN